VQHLLVTRENGSFFGVWSSIPTIKGCTRASSTPATTNWVGGREMCVGGLRLGCCELHAGELHTRPQWAEQAAAEVFLTADQASRPRGGGGSSLPHHGPAELVRTWLAASLDAMRMWMEAALVRTQALAELVRTWPKGGWCDGDKANGEDKMSLSFLFFRETVYADERSRPVGRSAVQLAASDWPTWNERPWWKIDVLNLSFNKVV
jgi:hypothetical protein